jgi:hypothetical protein
MKKLFISISVLLTGLALGCVEPFKPDYEIVAARVIKIAPCSADTLCLLTGDIKFPTNKYQFEDTLTVDGVLYKSVIKTYELPERYQVVGKKLSINFYLISKNKTSKCSGEPLRDFYEIRIKEVGTTNYQL